MLNPPSVDWIATFSAYVALHTMIRFSPAAFAAIIPAEIVLTGLSFVPMPPIAAPFDTNTACSSLSRHGSAAGDFVSSHFAAPSPPSPASTPPPPDPLTPDAPVAPPVAAPLAPLPDAPPALAPPAALPPALAPAWPPLLPLPPPVPL
ncbi:MAG TPA: hypothetical protein VHC69_23875 [Polyangiaceae bacterium]|nr:hypothetical protein [Polyangiaceae bacterium]